MIGIRLADGKYYPVFDETRQNRRRFVLTPANDNQKSVHILFYRSDNENFDRPRLLGSVNLDNIPPGVKDERDISIIIGVDGQQNLEVSARDESGGEEHQLTINTHLENDDPTGDNGFDSDELNLPESGDFMGDREDLAELHETASHHGGIIPGEDPDLDSSMESSFIEPRKPFKAGIIAVLVLVLASTLVGLSFLIFKLIQGPVVPPMV